MEALNVVTRTVRNSGGGSVTVGYGGREYVIEAGESELPDDVATVAEQRFYPAVQIVHRAAEAAAARAAQLKATTSVAHAADLAQLAQVQADAAVEAAKKARDAAAVALERAEAEAEEAARLADEALERAEKEEERRRKAEADRIAALEAANAITPATDGTAAGPQTPTAETSPAPVSTLAAAAAQEDEPPVVEGDRIVGGPPDQPFPLTDAEAEEARRNRGVLGQLEGTGIPVVPNAADEAQAAARRDARRAELEAELAGLQSKTAGPATVQTPDPVIAGSPQAAVTPAPATRRTSPKK